MYLIGLQNWCYAVTAVVLSNTLVGTLAHRKYVKDDNTTFTIDALPPAIEEVKKPDLPLLKEDIRIITEEFIDTMGSVSHIDLSSFYANYTPLRIEGYYKIADNLKQASSEQSFLVFDKNRDLRSQLIPRLIAQASTIYGPKFRACGFERVRRNSHGNNEIYATLLNDAYVKILAERYFNVYEDSLSNLDIDLVSYIEMLVGREYMESAFFRGRLDEVVDQLSLYTSKEKVIKMIRELDHLDAVRRYQSPVVQLLSSFTYQDIILRLLKMTTIKLQAGYLFSETEKLDIIARMNELTHSKYREGLFIRYSSPKQVIKAVEEENRAYQKSM